MEKKSEWSGAEMGADQAKNWLSGSGAVSGLKWPLKIRSNDDFYESHTHIQILLISQYF